MLHTVFSFGLENWVDVLGSPWVVPQLQVLKPLVAGWVQSHSVLRQEPIFLGHITRSQTDVYEINGNNCPYLSPFTDE